MYMLSLKALCKMHMEYHKMGIGMLYGKLYIRYSYQLKICSVTIKI